MKLISMYYEGLNTLKKTLSSTNDSFYAESMIFSDISNSCEEELFNKINWWDQQFKSEGDKFTGKKRLDFLRQKCNEQFLLLCEYGKI